VHTLVRISRTALRLALLLLAQTSGQAQAAGLQAGATVPPVVWLSVSPLNFGEIGTGVYEATAQITVRASKDITFRIALDGGQHPSSGLRSLRRLRGSDSLTYELWQDAGRSLPWGDAGLAGSYPNGTALPAIGTGTPQRFTVYGRLYSIEGMPAPGLYADTVTVTVHY
jgi:spore coat protein U-like protein